MHKGSNTDTVLKQITTKNNPVSHSKAEFMIAHLPLRLDAVVVFLIIELARLSGARVGCGTAVVLGDGLLVVDDLREVG